MGYPDVYTACDHVMDILPFKPTALEGIDHLLFESSKPRATSGRSETAARGKRLPDRRIRRRQQRRQRRPGAALHGTHQKDKEPAHDEVLRRPGRRTERSGTSAKTDSGRLPGCPADPIRGPAGKILPCRRRRSAPTSAICESCSTNMTISRRCTAISAKAAFTAASASTSTPRRASRSSEVH